MAAASSTHSEETKAIAIPDGGGGDPEPAKGNSYARLFTYNDTLGWTLNGIALVCIIGTGTLLPLMNVVFGKFITVFTKFGIGEMSAPDFRTEVGKWALYFIYLFVAKLVLTYIWTTILAFTSLRTTAAIKSDFVEKTLRQDISFFDSSASGSIAAQVSTNGNLIKNGISEKLGSIIQGLVTSLAAFIIAFASQWKLTLITVCIIPTILVVTIICVGALVQLETLFLPKYADAGKLAEEVLGSMRTVHSFWARPKLATKYSAHLADARVDGSKGSIWFGILFSAEYFCIFAGYGLAFWQGIRMYSSGEITEAGKVITVIFAVILAATAITYLIPQALTIAKATAAADELFQTIDRPSKIDPLSGTGDRPAECVGEVRLSGIEFTYPSRPNAKVLDNLSIHIPAGKTTALVGASGSGKSTIIGLLERWYMPDNGVITLDGNDIAGLNVQWLRTQMRLVQQEPVLFAGTIFQNVANGLVGTPEVNASDEEKMAMVEEACKAAYAHDFVAELPNGYLTEIGERAALLSGGQKQRIAIARSIISNPKILLLDEATSALDPKAERIVQDALDNVSAGRTTVVIAHKLSTIKNADNIIVMSEGAIIEQGTHDELIAAGGGYYRLVEAQQLGHHAAINQGDDSEDEDESLKNTAAADDIARVVTHKSAVSAMTHVGEDESQSAGFGLLKCLWILFSENKSLRWHFITILIGAVLGGLTFPALAVLFARALNAFQLTGSEMKEKGNFFALMFLVVGIANFFIYMTIGYLAKWVAEDLTYTLRLEMFNNIIKQDMEFFDKPDNTTGALVSRISSYPTYLNEFISVNLTFITASIVSTIATSILSIVVGWKLGLVVVFGTLMPLIFCGWLRIRLENNLADALSKKSGDSASLAAEAIASMRTVSSLTLESYFLDRFNSGIKAIEKECLKSIVWTMIWYALSQSINFLCMGLGFWYGGRLLSTGEYSTTQFFTVFIGIILCGEAAASVFAFTGSITNAHSAANYILWLRTLSPTITEHAPALTPSEKPPPTTDEKPTSAAPELGFSNLHFSYPQRPNRPILRGINARILPGQFCAFVGASGCGKTTMIALLERFYDSTTGIITLNNTDITTLCPRTYRSSIALVQQEPILYQGSIRENIAMGLETPLAEVTDSQIEEACKMANIYDFIVSLPEGMETLCGARGSQLSGGQKQRIAIARALIRNPKLLLLDEATSALDSESEKVVQEALERAKEGRTTVAVAHRLSTVMRADGIFVFERGRVVERGTHEELMGLRGVYWEMCLGQSLERGV